MQTVTIEDFLGLDLRVDPGDSQAAISLSNVTLLPGRVRTRYGSSRKIILGVVPRYLGVAPAQGHLIVGSGTTVEAYTATGAFVASNAISGGTFSGVAIGTTAGAFFYYSSGGAVPCVRRWDGTTWTSPAAFAATPSIRALAVTPSDNRLVLCHSPNTVRFSDPGLPETYAANNFVLLDPGDGDEIRGAAVFNNQLFVFKGTKFYVFYGQSTDATGNPIFNYRSVKAGIGMVADPCAICVGRDGVYFISTDGIYRTSGGSPECISRPLDPLFMSTPTPYFSTTLTGGFYRVAWVNEMLYVSAGANPLVFDPKLGQWTVWGFTTVIGAMTSFQFSNGGILAGPESLLVYAETDTSTIRYMDPAATTDANTVTPAIASHYRSAFSAFGTPGMKRLRQTILEGTGTPTLQWSQDWGALATGSAVALGGSTTPAVGRQRLASRGRAFSFQLGAGSGAWSINRLEAILHPQVRPAGITVQP